MIFSSLLLPKSFQVNRLRQLANASVGRRVNSSFENFPARQGLYNKELEKDSCGVGLVASLKKIPSRKIVVDANQMLVRMAHRGACGCEKNEGDGAGIMVAMPHEFYSKIVDADFGHRLGEPGSYGSGIVFVPKSPTAVMAIQRIFVDKVEQLGMRLIGWRRVPTDNSALGKAAISSEPAMEQIFIENTRNLPYKEFDAQLYLLRTLVEIEAERDAEVLSDMYVCSLSSQTITYKGQLTPEQLSGYFPDLQQPDFVSHMAMVHSRFSTNTFPSWPRAQPNRTMCHNGEINTLRGNKNWVTSRAGLMDSPLFNAEMPLTPALKQALESEGTPKEAVRVSASEVIRQAANTENLSDSGCFDKILELLSKASPRTLPEAVMMMVPEAWQGNKGLSGSKKAFYEYNSCLMEPWDGPAMIAFTDGQFLGATLDRNGLRPSRYLVTKDDVVMLSSEVGVVPELSDTEVKLKSRLEPGKMFLIDFDKGELVSDNFIKEQAAKTHPYREWLDLNRFTLANWEAAESPQFQTRFNFNTTTSRLCMHGYSHETLDMLLYPMGVGSKEALGSMGNDAALAVMSHQPRLVFDYFKQLFAQVTNPPIDPIREEMVMSLQSPVGPERNLLDVQPGHCARMIVEQPVLTLSEMHAVKSSYFRGWSSTVIDCTIPVGSTPAMFVAALTKICDKVTAAVQGSDAAGGAQVIVLSDRNAGRSNLPLPSLLTLGAVHQHLLKNTLRPKAALFVECGDAREVHDLSLLLGFGADGVCPYVAYEALAHMNHTGAVSSRCGEAHTNEELFSAYRKATAKGIRKVMSKMGISTLQSYKGAQVFEALGLSSEIMDKCFTNTASRIQGATFLTLFEDVLERHAAAFPLNANATAQVANPGQFHLRHGGEVHLNTPETMVALQQASQQNSREIFANYTRLTDLQNQKATLRGVLRFKSGDAVVPVPLEEVEPAASIVKRFSTGAMSLGSISQETHETLAVAMNSIGARSNTGEGGEDPLRFLDNRRSAIKQVASGRFGVTSHYLANADQIQIKMAQGAKPGEGGELPGAKVTPYIAENRLTTPGVGLISPPPHHDIYSIEDLSQLIYDLKNAQPTGEVSVKLVSEVGVGVVATGVVKAKADHITISGGDGGTGAAAWTGVKGAGLPWELGLAEAHQTLVLNNLRSRVRLQTDGQLKTGRDIVIAAMLGAEEFGFATAPLITLGCIMMRKCHLNTCPVGIATQDPELRKKFTGKPESVVNFFFLLAEEVRSYMAALGVRSLDELVGRVDLLEVDRSLLHEKNKNLDLSSLLVSAQELNAAAGLIKSVEQEHLLEEALDNELIRLAAPALNEGVPVRIDHEVTNLNRAVGTMLSYQISKKFGRNGLSPDMIHIKLRGHGGQSLGFALARGVFIEVEGDSNDYVGKALSGGKIAIYPHYQALANDFSSHENVIVGNVCLYGATSGEAYFRGRAGERFAVRNSGAAAVVEGVGDHGCEYMTGGRVVVLGETGRNFGAGMSGGIAYVYDPHGVFPDRCNLGMVDLEKVDVPEDAAELHHYLQQHFLHTQSSVAENLLSSWPHSALHFVKVMPYEYKRALQEGKQGKDVNVEMAVTAMAAVALEAARLQREEEISHEH